MAWRGDLWGRFGEARFWWMHAMVGLWLVFALMLFVIEPLHSFWKEGTWQAGKKLHDGFRYASDNNTEWLTVEELRRLTNVNVE